jgi:hypothetical protein
VTAAVLTLGVGVYVVFGRGVTPTAKNPKGNAAASIAPKGSPQSSKSASATTESNPARSRTPLDTVRQAVQRRFDKRVVVTNVLVEQGNLTLEGNLQRWEDLRPAREVAVKALEEGGFGPIRSWDNHLKKTKQ